MASFPSKLTGAQARLFAQGCRRFLEAAEQATIESALVPCPIPIFSWLSPHQRLALVAQVAVGLLCPDEPLPPATLEHVAAYHGVIEFIKSELELEVSNVYNSDVGQDLLHEFYETNRPPNERRRSSNEELEQKAPSKALIGRAAAKNKKKLDRNEQEDEEFKAIEPKFDYQEMSEKVENVRAALFSGPPCTQEDRRPPRPLTEIETKYGFDWRLKCDAAFQEDIRQDQPVCIIDFALPPLCMADFCWKSYDSYHQVD